MKTDAVIKRVTPLLADGESVLAATKAIPRGSAHEGILGAAGAVAGSTINPLLSGAGAVAGSGAGTAPGEAGRAERDDAGVDVGRASQVLLVVTEDSVVLFALSALGRPKDITARLDRARISSVTEGTASLFGQKMSEIVITTDDGTEIGFGVAKVHRRQGEAVLAALG